MVSSLEVSIERWPIAGSFTIARGAKTEATVVVAQIGGQNAIGRGEAVPYARYGETPEGVVAGILAMKPHIANGINRDALRRVMPAGAARNALDCALWDFEAKQSGRSASEIAGLSPMRPLETAFTLSLGTPEAMAEAARAASDRPVLKVKLGASGDAERIAAVRAAVPDARLIVDANEGWRDDTLIANIAACKAAGVVLIEQPLPASEDTALETVDHFVPICADESFHTVADLTSLRSRYDAVNVKLDKTGGLTEALEAVIAAKSIGFGVMVGCMVGTSLAMAPAMLAAQAADFVDLDGPLLLAEDRSPGLFYEGGTVYPPESSLWG
ncbi:N-acetyl-D-Glu racemase DgcA [Bauldia sp.]|uniref:N-acetyl-D-Glu racemase DgcA n=1 Tax=Bauldia sp. TaxID=2575872 RepID=UPI003BA920B3